ncbi:MAG: hypothetical protein LBR93_11240, partial [Treponema sp.]|nr:hypothetical protein [Treponema sp.]
MKRKGLFAAMFSMALAFGILIGACSMGGDSSSSGPGPVTDNPSTGVMSEATGRAIFAISPASGGVSIDRFIDAAALEAYLTLPARASVGGGSVLKINKIGLWNVVAIGDGAFDPSKGAASLAAAGVTTISLPVTITVIVPNAFTGAESAAGSGVKITLEIPSSVIDDVINNLSQDDKDELEGAITVAPVEVIPDGLNVDTALARGKDALKAGNYDAAVGYYQAAYQAGPNNPEAITYSVLAELAAISVDPDVQILVRDRLGVVNYPGTMGV